MTDPIDNATFQFEEPSADVDTGANSGLGGQFSDFVNYGLYNGAFQNGPPNPGADLDVGTSTSGSNFMPNWRFVQSSNTNITARQVRDAQSPSGSNIRFTFASGSANDEAYLEQIVDIGGNRGRQQGAVVRAWVFRTAGANFDLRVMVQYLTVDGAPIGNATQGNVSVAATGSLVSVAAQATADSSPSQQAKSLRVRLVANRTSGTGAGSIDLSDVRLERAAASILLAERTLPGSYGPAWAAQSSGVLFISPNNLTGVLSSTKPGITIDDSTDTVSFYGGLVDVKSGQIKFPATANPSSDANTLDDYEEGTFTPAFGFVTTDATSWTYANQQGTYTKIGNAVTFAIRCQVSTFTKGAAAGNFQVKGLPFTVGSGVPSGNATCVMTGYTKAGFTTLVFATQGGSTNSLINASGSGNTITNLAVGDFTTLTAVEVRAGGTYYVD